VGRNRKEIILPDSVVVLILNITLNYEKPRNLEHNLNKVLNVEAKQPKYAGKIFAISFKFAKIVQSACGIALNAIISVK